MGCEVYGFRNIDVGISNYDLFLFRRANDSEGNSYFNISYYYNAIAIALMLIALKLYCNISSMVFQKTSKKNCNNIVTKKKLDLYANLFLY